MESYIPPLGPKDPYDRYRVEEIQKDPSGSFRAPREEPPKKPNLLAYVIWMLRRLFQLLDTPLLKKKPSSPRVNLRLFKTAIETLQNKDKSQDGPFLNHLSELWHQLKDDEKKFPALQSLIESIQTYPPGQDHTLGYYLTEYVGQKWLPFPLMEMVLNLHVQHKKSPLNSTLAGWIQQIDSLLAILL